MANNLADNKVTGDVDDALIACIAMLAHHFGQTFQPMTLAALVRDRYGYLPFHQLQAALDLCCLNSHLLKTRRIRSFARKLPAIICLKDGRYAVVLDRQNEGRYLLWEPGPKELHWVERESLEQQYAGDAMLVAADTTAIRTEERPWDKPTKRHWFWDELYRMRRSFYPVLGGALMINMLGFVLPLFTMNVYDRVIPNKAIASLWVLAIGAVLAFFIEFVLRLARAKLLDDLGRELDIKLSEKILSKVINIPLKTRRGSTGSLVRRVSEFEIVRDFFAATTIVLFVDLAFLFLFIIMIAVLAGWLFLVPLTIIFIMLLAGYTLQRRMVQATADNQADMSLQHSLLVETIAGAETVKACAAEGQVISQWRRMVSNAARTQAALRANNAAATNLAALGQQFSSLGLIIGGFYLFDAGTISMGAIIAIVMLASRSMMPVGQLAFLMTRGRQAITTMNSIQMMMQIDDERKQGSTSLALSIAKGDIRVENLGFTYAGSPSAALSDINITIKPGEKIAIIGRVASGKSTLGRLLCGLYVPDQGNIFIDNLDSRQYSPLHVRSQFCFVGQDAVLFNGSIKQNLQFGAPALQDNQLLDVLNKVGADYFIGRDSIGLDRTTGERGSQLSGGQRSFLVIARALAVPRKLVFLDEPTGAMDVNSEKRFISDLQASMTSEQTLIIATHRQAVLPICDRLIVIDAGRIVADGPRDEILARVSV